MSKTFTLFLAALAVPVAILLTTPALAGDDPIDCSNGCTIVTCDGNLCTVYHCDSSGCRVIGTYPDEKVQGSGPDSESAGSSRPQPLYGTEGNGLDCGRAACAIKTCDAAECKVFGFKNGEAFHLGTVDNTEPVLNAIAEDFLAQDEITREQ